MPARRWCRGKLRRDPVVAAAATPDGRGYWLVTSRGQVMPSVTQRTTLDHKTDEGPRRRDGGHRRRQGILDRLQHRRSLQLRRRPLLRLGEGRHPRSAIVAMAATPDSGGYWLVDADGSVFRFGDALHLALREKPGRASSVSLSPPTNRSLDGRAERHRTEPRHGDRRGSLMGVPTTHTSSPSPRC